MAFQLSWALTTESESKIFEEYWKDIKRDMIELWKYIEGQDKRIEVLQTENQQLALKLRKAEWQIEQF